MNPNFFLLVSSLLSNQVEIDVLCAHSKLAMFGLSCQKHVGFKTHQQPEMRPLLLPHSTCLTATAAYTWTPLSSRLSGAWPLSAQEVKQPKVKTPLQLEGSPLMQT